MRSRSWNAHRNGVKAPRSIDVVPSHTMCEMMRLISQAIDRKSTRLNSSHVRISYAVFCLKKKKRPRKSSQGRVSYAVTRVTDKEHSLSYGKYASHTARETLSAADSGTTIDGSTVPAW